MLFSSNEVSYTFADYLTWDGNERFELLDGSAVMMAPPNAYHQLILAELVRQLGNYLDGKKCKVILAPFSVRLFEKDSDSPDEVKTVVQPDISVMCDPDRLDKQGYRGAPDMVVEILSPSTARYDRLTKFNLYAKAGVKEYWIVSPEEKSVMVFLLENGNYWPVGTGHKDDTLKLKVNVLEDCLIDLSKVFAE